MASTEYFGTEELKQIISWRDKLAGLIGLKSCEFSEYTINNEDLIICKGTYEKSENIKDYVFFWYFYESQNHPVYTFVVFDDENQSSVSYRTASTSMDDSICFKRSEEIVGHLGSMTDLVIKNNK